MKMLICEGSSPAAGEVVRFGLALAQAAGAKAVRFHARDGDPVEKILTESAAGGFNLIVIGSRGGRGLAKLLMGSTSSRLAKQSPLPLLIVKGQRPSLRRILACTSG